MNRQILEKKVYYYNDVIENFDKYELDSVVYLSTKNDRSDAFDVVISEAEERNVPVNIYKV